MDRTGSTASNAFATFVFGGSAGKLLLVAGGFVLAACVDPKGDYKTYVDRTRDLRGAPVVDSGEVEVGDADPAADFSGTFLASCLPAAAGGNASQSFLFYVETVVTDGATLDIEITPILETATTFAKSQTVGTPQVAKGIPIVDGTWNAVIGDATVPGESQRIGPSPIVIRNYAYAGRTLSRDRLCAELSGEVISPIPIDFSPPGDPCIFVRLNEGDTLPTANEGGTEFVGFTAAEHRCP